MKRYRGGPPVVSIHKPRHLDRTLALAALAALVFVMWPDADPTEPPREPLDRQQVPIEGRSAEAGGDALAGAAREVDVMLRDEDGPLQTLEFATFDAPDRETLRSSDM